ncbi:MAG: N-acetylmuramoyl-L-alanine amidase [Planctomycetota bacterium]
MDRSRTIKTLAALLAALTVGTFVLLALETRPAQPGRLIPLTVLRHHNDAILSEVASAAVPIAPDRWRNVVIHDSICDMEMDPTADCHFVIYGPASGELDGTVRATPRWHQQKRGNHVAVPGHDYDAVSVGICLEGDLMADPPSTEQIEALTALTRALQRRLSIAPERVYLHSDLSAVPCPGRRFPLRAFRDNLLPADR